MKKRYIIASFLLLFYMCNDPLNPFVNPYESKAVFHNLSFVDGDSINIFSTRSFSVVVEFREYVDHYSVHVDNNRLWKFPDSIITKSQISSTPLKFQISFSDTGLKKIELITYLKNGTKINKNIEVYAKSPLYQKQIKSKKGDTVILKTLPVGDSVAYIWDLRNGEIVKSDKPEVNHVIENTIISSQGELYVSDGNVNSPRVLFPISDSIIPPLVVKYGDTGNIFNDTIKTRSDSYELIAFLKGALALNGATLNGIPFKVEVGDSGAIVLRSTISGLDTVKSVQKLHIYIKDVYGRVFLDTLYLEYTPEIRSDITFTVHQPADSSTIHDSLVHIYGIINGANADSTIAVFAKVNDTGKPVRGKLDQKVWSFDLVMAHGWNKIAIESFNDSTGLGKVTGSIIHHVFYSPSVTFTCVNDSVSGDTVFTGSTYIDFAVLVTTSFKIKSARINSGEFDNMNTLSANSYKFMKNIRELDKSGLMSTIIEITSPDDQIYKDTFYIRYSENIIVNKPNLVFLSPVDDSTITNESQFRVSGKIDRHLQYGNVCLFASVNSVVSPVYSRVDKDSMWNLIVLLKNGWNEVIVNVFEDSSRNGASLAKGTIFIKYELEFIDSSPPSFISIKTGNDIEISDGFISHIKNLDLKITVIDNVKPVSVMVEDNILAKTEDNYLFTCVVPLNHVPGNTIKINAYDKKGNFTSVNRKVCYNTAPVFSSVPGPQTLYTDSSYTFQTIFEDDDKDKVLLTVRIQRGSHDTVITANDGYFNWRPTLSDVGQRMFTFIAWDGFEQVEKTVTMLIARSNGQVPVKWLTKPDEFKDSYKEGIDTISKVVIVDPLTGSKPFTFLALIDGENIPITKVYDDSIYFKWMPTTYYRGNRTLRFIVSDRNGSLDTLILVINIEPPSQINISWKPSIASYREEAITLNKYIIAHLSVPAPSRMLIPCVIDWLQSTASKSDIEISDTSFLNFNQGDTVASIVFKVKNDSLIEDDEYFHMRFVSLPSYVQLLSGEKFSGTIIDDDKVSYSFEKRSVSKAESINNSPIEIFLSRSVPYGIVIECTIDESSTAESSDFTLVTNRITIPTNNLNGKIRLRINNDNLKEVDETIVLKIKSNSKGAIPGDITKFIYTIQDDSTR